MRGLNGLAVVLVAMWGWLTVGEGNALGPGPIYFDRPGHAPFWSVELGHRANDSGQVVGDCDVLGIYHAFLYSGGSMVATWAASAC